MLDIDKLKYEYIGKEINWLTVIDIFRNDKNTVVFKCRCRCGKENIVSKKVILGNKAPISCGCYKQSKEYSMTHIMSDETKYKISVKRKQWCKDNPDKVKAIGKHNSELYEIDPERRLLVGKKISNWFKTDPAGVKAWCDARRLFYVNNPDIGKRRSQLYKDNPDILRKISEGNIKYNLDHHEKVVSINEVNHFIAKEKRLSVNYSSLLQTVHPDDIEIILSGNASVDSVIRTKCPICDMYAEHYMRSIFVLSRGEFKNGNPPLCESCHIKLTSCFSSKAEQEIADYISTFYSGNCIRNDREILCGKELDLYYPEKKIAIEFNGDYWHDENHKSRDYHYNKYLLCKNIGITLISVFEYFWNHYRDLIKDYLKCTFNNITNSLSYTTEGYMNNNYPDKDKLLDGDYIEDSYMLDGITVYTCGLTKLNS